MDYQHHTTEDFLLNESFQSWVFSPSPKEERFWENFLAQHPEKSVKIYAAKAQLQSIRFQEHTVDSKTQARVRARLIANISHKAMVPAQRRATLVRQFLPYLAAACLAAAAISIGIWQHLKSQYTIYETAQAETQEVWLPDSTSVTLNANSLLRVRYADDRLRREVWLEGEAFFRVAHNSQRPFIVYADDMQVRVTGTAFNVSNRGRDTEVVLTSGQVILQAEALTQPLVMAPGDLVAYDKELRAVRQQTVEPDQYTAWRDRIYFFEEATLTEVAEVIQNYYSIKVEIPRDLASLTFTAKVQLQANPQDLLTLLSETLDISIRTDQQQIIVQPK